MLEKEKFLAFHGRSRQESDAAVAFVQKHWAKETAHRIRIADEVVQHIFLFDLPWDMEQTAESVQFGEKIDWFYKPGEDPEFIYQLNRHRYWICLGQAYQITGKEKYAEAFVSQLTDWIKASPLTKENEAATWRSIEAGLRAESWIKAMGYMAESPAVTDEVFALFVNMLSVHGEYLYVHDVPFGIRSNWGVLESSGLYAIGKVLTGCTDETLRKRGETFASAALVRLEKQICVQVMGDGVHWEQSPMYHNEVLKCCLEVLRIANVYGDFVSETIRSRVKSMLYADRMWQCPGGCQIAGGDSDVTDLRDILSIGALQFHDPVLKSGGFLVLDYEGIWDYGMAGEESYRLLPSKDPKETAVWMKDSGNFYLRSGWEETADYLHVRCGSLGGGHGHFDKLHIDLMVQGEDVLIDPGRFTYVDGADRKKFKSAKAHNVCTVDGAEYTQCTDAWDVAGLPLAVNTAMYRKGAYTFIQCGHLGYMEKGVFVNRKIIAIGTKAYLIADEFFGVGNHTYRQHFHLPVNKTAEKSGENSFLVTGEQYQVKICCLSEDVRMESEEFGVSRHYNTVEPGEMVSFAKTISGNGCMMTVILCEKDAECERVFVEADMGSRTLSDREADGICVKIGGKTYAAVIAHADTGGGCQLIGCMGKSGIGRVMIAEVQQEEHMTVLQW